MIRMSASAVFQVRDGFTGQIVDCSRLVCALDGVPMRPVAKPGGYLVLMDLPTGDHRLDVRCGGYQTEQVEFTVEKGALLEGYIALKPGQQYQFRQSVTRLELTVPTGLRELWISAPSSIDCKVAQAKAEPGSSSFRVYCSNPARLPIPGVFLIEDGDNSELVVLLDLSEELCQLAAPLQREHSRSRRLLPIQQYRPDAVGQIHAVFPNVGTVVLYDGSSCRSLELREGENRLELE